MSVSDVPTVFREETRLFLLFPSTAHGYLYHTTGNTIYIILATIALVPPSLSFCLFYVHGLNDMSEYYEYVNITAGRVSVFLVILYGVLGLIHLGSVIGLALHMDHTDYIHVFLFLSSIFLILMTFWTGYYSNELEKFKSVEKISPAERIDEKFPNDKNK